MYPNLEEVKTKITKPLESIAEAIGIFTKTILKRARIDLEQELIKLITTLESLPEEIRQQYSDVEDLVEESLNKERLTVDEMTQLVEGIKKVTLEAESTGVAPDLSNVSRIYSKLLLNPAVSHTNKIRMIDTIKTSIKTIDDELKLSDNSAVLTKLAEADSERFAELVKQNAKLVSSLTGRSEEDIRNLKDEESLRMLQEQLKLLKQTASSIQNLEKELDEGNNLTTQELKIIASELRNLSASSKDLLILSELREANQTLDKTLLTEQDTAKLLNRTYNDQKLNDLLEKFSGTVSSGKAVGQEVVNEVLKSIGIDPGLAQGTFSAVKNVFEAILGYKLLRLGSRGAQVGGELGKAGGLFGRAKAFVGELFKSGLRGGAKLAETVVEDVAGLVGIRGLGRLTRNLNPKLLLVGGLLTGGAALYYKYKHRDSQNYKYKHRDSQTESQLATPANQSELTPVTPDQLKRAIGLNENQAKFVSDVYNAALKLRQEGEPIDPKVVTSQAILETGYGKSLLAQRYHNLFGVKAGKSWHGQVAVLPTTEYVNGKSVRVNARFRAYRDYEEALRDYARIIKEKPWFQDAEEAALEGSTEAYIAGILPNANEPGWATDPRYGQKIKSLVSKLPTPTPTSTQTPVAATQHTPLSTQASVGVPVASPAVQTAVETVGTAGGVAVLGGLGASLGGKVLTRTASSKIVAKVTPEVAPKLLGRAGVFLSKGAKVLGPLGVAASTIYDAATGILNAEEILGKAVDEGDRFAKRMAGLIGNVLTLGLAGETGTKVTYNAMQKTAMSFKKVYDFLGNAVDEVSVAIDKAKTRITGGAVAPVRNVNPLNPFSVLTQNGPQMNKPIVINNNNNNTTVVQPMSVDPDVMMIGTFGGH